MTKWKRKKSEQSSFVCVMYVWVLKWMNEKYVLIQLKVNTTFNYIILFIHINREREIERGVGQRLKKFSFFYYNPKLNPKGC